MKAQIAKGQAEIDEPAMLAAKQAEWESAVRSESSAWTVLQPTSMTSSGGATLTKQADESILASGAHDNRDGYTITAPTDLKNITAFRIEALPDESLPAKGPGRAGDGNFVLNDFKVGVQAAGEVAKSVRGRFVRIELAGEKRMIHIAELQAFSGEENVALKGAATQSSTAFDGPAGRAIDGNTDGVFANGSVNHTAVENDPWWEVDLKEPRELNKLVVWPRADGSALFSRLDGLRVSILDENRKPVWTTVLDKGPRQQTALNPSGPSLVPLKNATATFSQSEYSVGEAIDGNAREK